MRKNIIYLMIVLIMLVLPLCYAESSYVFKQNQPVNLQIPVFDSNNGKATDAIDCFLTVSSPTQQLLISDANMTFSSNGMFNYTVSNLAELGVYPASMRCTDGITPGFSTFTIEITQSGTILDTGQSVLYVIFCVVSFGIFILCIYGSLTIPWKNKRSMDNTVVDINWMKYLKLFCIVFAYITFMLSIGLVTGIASNFLEVVGIHSMFEWIYWVLLSCLWPLIVMAFIFALLQFLNDKKLNDALIRGVPFR